MTSPTKVFPRMGRPPRATTDAARTIRLYLTEAEGRALDERARLANRTRNAQVTHEIERWLASTEPQKIDERPKRSPNRPGVRLSAAILGKVEAAVGIEKRTRAIETAVRQYSARS